MALTLMSPSGNTRKRSDYEIFVEETSEGGHVDEETI
jgi:hypothetical protein